RQRVGFVSVKEPRNRHRPRQPDSGPLGVLLEPLERAGRKLDPLVFGQLAAKLGVMLRPQHIPLAIHAVDEPVPPYPPLERSRVPAHCVPPSRRSKSWRMATSTSSCIGVPLFAAYTFSRWCRSLGT